MKTTRHLLAGVFLISMGALALEVVLTRIFSVTMWYHFAFLAISMALMGSAMAGVFLYFFPKLQSGAGGFGKLRDRSKIEGDHPGVTFADVAGEAEAVAELREITEFLTAPERFHAAILCDTRSEADGNEGKIMRARTMAAVKSRGSSWFADDFIKKVFAEVSFTRVPEAVEHIRTTIAIDIRRARRGNPGLPPQ